MNQNNILKIENATIFHHYKTILNDVNLNLKEGEFIYVIGKTGSGKSSLLRTIYRDISGIAELFDSTSIKLSKL